MTEPFGPPFRADHVGSLLRPERLKRARDEFLGAQTVDDNLGPHNNDDLCTVEDSCVHEVIELQRRAGLRSATDGEFRRRSWWLELIMGWDGVSATREGAKSPFSWRNEAGEQQKFSSLTLEGPIRWQPSSIVRAFAFLAANVGDGVVPKVTIPAPQVVHCMVGGDQAVRDGPYDDVNAFWEDVVSAYCQELAAGEFDEQPFGDRSHERDIARRIASELKTIWQLTREAVACKEQVPERESSGFIDEQLVKLTAIGTHLDSLAILAARLPTFLQSRMHDLAHEVRGRYRTLIITTWAAAIAAVPRSRE